MMNDLCDKKLNLTIIVKTFKRTLLKGISLIDLDEKQNEITGLFGSKLNSLLRRKSSSNTCRLVSTENLGLQINPNNQTFSGALGLLQAGKGDLILDSLSRRLQKPWLMHSHASTQQE